MARTRILTKEQIFEAYYYNREKAGTEQFRSTEQLAKNLPVHYTKVNDWINRFAKEFQTDKTLKAEYDKWKETNPELQTDKERIEFYTFTKDSGGNREYSSSYEGVKDYLSSHPNKVNPSVLNYAWRAWIVLNRKNPSSWTRDDFNRVIFGKYLPSIETIGKKRGKITNPESPLSEQMQFPVAVAMRAVSKNLRDIPRLTDGLKHPRIDRLDIFEAQMKYIVRTIDDALVNPSFDNLTIKNYISKHGAQRDLVINHALIRDAKLVFLTHVDLGCREGTKKLKGGKQDQASILGLDWREISWEQKSINVFESKVVGWWNDCPLDLFGDYVFTSLKQRFDALGRPSSGRIFPIGYDQGENSLINLYRIVNYICGAGEISSNSTKPIIPKFTPHGARKIHVNLLWEQGIPLELVIGDADAHIGFFGVGWKDVTTARRFYLSMAKQKLLENRAKAKSVNLS